MNFKLCKNFKQNPKTPLTHIYNLNLKDVRLFV